eukprot:7608298-Pyramimonas_sp.AAC.1
MDLERGGYRDPQKAQRGANLLGEGGEQGPAGGTAMGESPWRGGQLGIRRGQSKGLGSGEEGARRPGEDAAP